ncbi:HNH endonuclease family protein [Actinocorallia sp. A-T 12471]|uniref:HNH endonuclease family protein n=1 Tax=Actinocorallia sp. A-T 12471 TaxID=3089813 RepID=UPI0029D0F079|nr:HNH endonuclease family protein [Actinocorallia sp. A-T 12471]MDX6738250.1 HNH endonuclease family protein [Actinocorallia sp. A-T 12471]
MLRQALAAICAALTLTSCSVVLTSPETEGGAETTEELSFADKRVLDMVGVAKEVNDGSYDRKAFGTSWKDVDRNRCDTRNDILARDLADITKRDDCVVLSGVLKDDPYGDGSIDFDRARPTEVQIDHIYPLALAWRMGASQWDKDKREKFANDPDNLLAVGGRANQRKGDSGPEEWQPPRDYQCEYAKRFIGVALAYELPVTAEAHRKLGEMQKTC